MSYLRPGHSLTLLTPGSAFFSALLKAMAGAHRSIWLETYIFEMDTVGQAVAQAMVAAAARGVDVRVVVDGYGTGALPAVWQQRLAEAGVKLQVFVPRRWFSPFYPGHWRRLHRKLAVVDGLVGFCGGVNIIDDFEDGHLGRLQHPRLDFAVEVRGPLVADMAQTMVQLWARLQWWADLRPREFEALWLSWRQQVPAPPPGGLAGPAQAGLVLRDNLKHRGNIEKAYLKAIGNARQEVLIANAYFVPGYRLRRALRMAALRGVKVRLLLQGQYEHFMQYHASRSVYAKLLAAGVDIVEYRLSHLHGKVAVVDGRWATVGSSNLDPLSLLLAREANIEVQDTRFAQALRICILDAMRQGGVPLDQDRFLNRPWRQRFLDWLALGLARVLVAISGERYR